MELRNLMRIIEQELGVYYKGQRKIFSVDNQLLSLRTPDVSVRFEMLLPGQPALRAGHPITVFTAPKWGLRFTLLYGNKTDKNTLVTQI